MLSSPPPWVATAAEIDALTDDPWVTGGEPEWEWLRDKEWAFIGSAPVWRRSQILPRRTIPL